MALQQVVDSDVAQSGKKLPQYIAALSATLGSLSTGIILGWSSPASPRLQGGEYDFEVTEEDFAWISSLATLGAACICIPIAVLMNKIGRKWSMLCLTLPFTVGWILMITASNLAMMYAGRFILGLAGGAFCVTAPTYTSEIAEDSIRGTVGIFFELMITIGILFAYAVGSYVEVFTFNIICLVIPLIFAAIFFFMPETPYYLLTKNKLEEANKSLLWLRGPQYNTGPEIKELQRKIDITRANSISFKDIFTKKTAMKALVITYFIMFFQEFSGINAVVFNSDEIFTNADVPSKEFTVILGVFQVAGALFSTIVVDRLGRKFLLYLSGCAMGVCGIALGVYFYLMEELNENVDNLSWLPLVSLVIFVFAFEIGFGSIAWLIASDLCTPEIKPIVNSTAGTFNWTMAFIITRTFVDMKNGMGNAGTFWFFAAVSFTSIVFVHFFVPETKGKSIDEVQLILKGTTITEEKNKHSP